MPGLRSWARDRVKPIEVAGRYLLQWLAAMLLAVRRRPLDLPDAPRVLVVRLDRRVGNLMLLTPLLRSLKQGLPKSHITVLCHEDMARLLANNPFIDALERFTKWAWFSRRGVPAMLWRMRRARFDVAFDAGSFFGAAVTHPLITRFSGARRFVGPKREPLWRVYHQPVSVLPEAASDIDQRLQLLGPLPQVPPLREMAFATPERLRALAEEHAQLLRELGPAERTVLCVVGARIPERRVSPEVWAAIVGRIAARGLRPVLIWGPGEKPLAEAVAALVTEASIAPPTNLDQIAILFNRMKGVIGHDTGTSHLAVAVQAKTFVMFVCEAPSRYGHSGPGRTWIDLRNGVDKDAIVAALDRWLGELQK